MEETEFNFVGGKSSFIMEAKNLIPKDTCDLLVTESLKYYDHLFAPGPTIGGVNAFIKNSMDFNFSQQAVADLGIPTDIFASCEAIIADRLFAMISYYVNQYRELWEWPGICDTGFRLQRYIRNYGYYRQHVDANPWGKKVVSGRVLAAVVYLNTVEKGGETYFPEHDVSVPAVAGSVSLFPAAWTHPHQGNTPLGNDKWMISTFYMCSTPMEDEAIVDGTPKEIESKDKSVDKK